MMYQTKLTKQQIHDYISNFFTLGLKYTSNLTYSVSESRALTMFEINTIEKILDTSESLLKGQFGTKRDEPLKIANELERLANHYIELGNVATRAQSQGIFLPDLVEASFVGFTEMGYPRVNTLQELIPIYCDFFQQASEYARPLQKLDHLVLALEGLCYPNPDIYLENTRKSIIRNKKRVNSKEDKTKVA